MLWIKKKKIMENRKEYFSRKLVENRFNSLIQVMEDMSKEYKNMESVSCAYKIRGEQLRKELTSIIRDDNYHIISSKNLENMKMFGSIIDDLLIKKQKKDDKKISNIKNK